MGKRKPLIGITGPDKGGTAAWWFTRFAIWLQGGSSVRIRPSEPHRGIELDGLILGGGADINPERYGQSLMEGISGKKIPKPSGVRQWFFRIISFFIFPILLLIRKLFSTKSPTLDEARDEIESALLNYALEKGIPILGICRGAQLINVHFGGNLHQDIDTFYREVPKVNTIWPEKEVAIKKGSKLEKVLETSKVWVNALHHQAVDSIGESLSIVAKEETGIAQAIENPDYCFLIGVQWHPEYMPQIPKQRALFRALVDNAKHHMNERGKGASDSDLNNLAQHTRL